MSSSRRFGRINELARVRSRAQTQRTRKSGLVGEATATTDGGGGRPAGRVIPARSPHHCLLVLDSPTKPNQTKPRRKGRARHSHSHAPGRHVHTLRHSTSSVAPKHLDIFPRNPQAWAATTTSVSLSLSVVLFLKKKLALPHGYDGGSPSDRGLPRRKRRVIFSVLPLKYRTALYSNIYRTRTCVHHCYCQYEITVHLALFGFGFATDKTTKATPDLLINNIPGCQLMRCLSLDLI